MSDSAVPRAESALEQAPSRAGGPPRRLPLAGGTWCRARRIPDTGKALFTGPDGRFLIAPSAEIDAICRSQPGDEWWERLDRAGLLFFSEEGSPSGGRDHRRPRRDAGEGGPAAPPSDSSHHIVLLNEAGVMGPRSVDLDLSFGRQLLDRILALPSRFVHVELEAWDTTKAAENERIARELLASAVTRPPGPKQLSLGLRAPLSALSADVVDPRFFRKVALTAYLDGLPDEQAAARLRAIHERYAALGLPPSLAFVKVVLRLTEAVIAFGAERIVDACARAGVVFLVLARGSGAATKEYVQCYRAIAKRILDLNTAGTLLVDMELALRHETLNLHARPGSAAPPTPATTVWNPTGEIAPVPPGLDGTGCGGCAYDPYCGAGLLNEPVRQSPWERRWGTPFCEASTGQFDALFQSYGWLDAPRLHKVFATWRRLHERIAERLAPAG